MNFKRNVVVWSTFVSLSLGVAGAWAQPPHLFVPHGKAIIGGTLTPAAAWATGEISADDLVTLLDVGGELKPNVRQGLVALLARHGFEKLLPPDETPSAISTPLRREVAKLYAQNRDRRAIALFQMLVEEAEDGPPKAIMLFDLAHAHRDLNEHRVAAETLLLAVPHLREPYPSWAGSTLLEAARYFETVGDRERADATWRQIPEVGTGWEYAFMQRHFAGRKFGEGDIEGGRAILHQPPKGVDAAHGQMHNDNWLVRSYLATGEMDEAAKVARKAVANFEALTDYGDDGRGIKGAGASAHRQLKEAQFGQEMVKRGLGVRASGIWIQPYSQKGKTFFSIANLRPTLATLSVRGRDAVGNSQGDWTWTFKSGEVRQNADLGPGPQTLPRYLEFFEGETPVGTIRTASSMNQAASFGGSQEAVESFWQNLNGADTLNRGWSLEKSPGTERGNSEITLKVSPGSGVVAFSATQPPAPDALDLPTLKILDVSSATLPVEKTDEGWRVDSDKPVKPSSNHIITVRVQWPTGAVPTMARLDATLEHATGLIPLRYGLVLGEPVTK